MDNNERRSFLKKLSILLIASAVAPRFLFGSSKKSNFIGNGKVLSIIPIDSFEDNDFGVVDLHSHPSQKYYLLKRPMWSKHPAHPGPNNTSVQINTESLNKGYYKGLVATHYLPEISLTKKSKTFKILFPFLKRIRFSLAEKLESGDMGNFAILSKMMTQLEDEVIAENNYLGKRKIVIVPGYKRFKEEIDKGNIPFAHALEGAHSLGRIIPPTLREREIYLLARDTSMRDDISKKNKYKQDLATYQIKPIDSEVEQIIKDLPVITDEQRKIDQKNAKQILDNLKILRDRGVCLITLGHFFPNDIIPMPAEGISYDEKNSILLKIGPLYDPIKDQEQTEPLTKLGEEVVNRMFELGIIVDLTHSGPCARRRVFELNELYNNNPKNIKKRPVIFSHSGVQALFNPNVKYSNYKYYDASDDEIDRIKKCGGVIGIIPEVFFLEGCDTHLNDVKKSDYRYGIKYMIDTMDYIYQRTGSYDHIAIGSDFDGLADDPKDLYSPSQFGGLIQAMHDRGISYADIKKITHGNAMRVLENGWGDQDTN